MFFNPSTETINEPTRKLASAALAAAADVLQSAHAPSMNDLQFNGKTNVGAILQGQVPILTPKVKFPKAQSKFFNSAEVSVIGWRGNQEDSAFMNGTLFGMLDGHGGPMSSYLLGEYYHYIYRTNRGLKAKEYEAAFEAFDPTQKTLLTHAQAMSDTVHQFDNLLREIDDLSTSEDIASSVTCIAMAERDAKIQTGYMPYDQQFDHDKLYRDVRERLAVTQDKEAFDPSVTGDILKEFCQEQDLNFNHMAQKINQGYGMRGSADAGCTATVGKLINTADGVHLLVSNLGDSETMIVRNGRGISMTKNMDLNEDNGKEIERAVANGGEIVKSPNGASYLYAAPAAETGKGVNMYGCVGDLYLKNGDDRENFIATNTPDITAIKLCKEDEFIVLYCDGVGNSMAPQTVADRLKTGAERLEREFPDMDDAQICAKLGEDLVQNCCLYTQDTAEGDEIRKYGSPVTPTLDGGGFDNASAMVIRLSDALRATLPSRDEKDEMLEIALETSTSPVKIHQKTVEGCDDEEIKRLEESIFEMQRTQSPLEKTPSSEEE